ncbi:protein FAM47E [Rattus rattus]|uniref:protein FAM47E n=1 Tax=Rattus rattus TaxID=10117 RepID=UPI0013F35F9A|nr:protein FAM47E [Rattus rattus]
MAERGQRLQPKTLAPKVMRERRNCGWYLENLPSKRLPKSSRLTLNSRHWVFVKEGLDDFRKDRPPHQGPKDAFLPLIHHGAPNATPKRRQSRLPTGTTLLSKLSKAGKTFLEEVEAKDDVLHPLALYPQIKEALPAELLLKVLEVLDPERKLEDAWACCRDTRELMKEPTKLVEERSSQVCPPKKMLMSRSGQWLCEEKPSKVDSLYKDSLLHDDIHRGVSNFCHWAADLGSSTIEEEFVLQQFDIDYQTRRSCDELHRLRLTQDKPCISGPPSQQERCGHGIKPPSSGRANPQQPKRVRMRYGAWYLNTNLWKRQRADEPLVDPRVSPKAQDSNFGKQVCTQAELLADLRGTAAFKDFVLSRGYRMPRFLEKIYAEEEKSKSENIKTPKKLTETERNSGRR